MNLSTNHLNLYFEREATDAGTFDMYPGQELHMALKATLGAASFSLGPIVATWADAQPCPEGKERYPDREAQGGECVDQCPATQIRLSDNSCGCADGEELDGTVCAPICDSATEDRITNADGTKSCAVKCTTGEERDALNVC